jgi:SAM-dependent methyltransferase
MDSSKYIGDDVLDIMTKYAPNRNRYIEKLIVKNLKFDTLISKSKVLEFGAGKGEFIFRFLSRKNLDLYAVELDTSYKNELSSKVKVFQSIDDIKEQMDCIYLIDVLEHMEDDELIIRKFYDKLKPGGRLFIYIPARMELYSLFDEKIGHFRRYSLKEIKRKTDKAGFIIEVARYHELLGYFASFYNKIFGKKGELNVKAVGLYDKFLVPSTNFIEKYIPVPIGKSIYLSAIRKD